MAAAQAEAMTCKSTQKLIAQVMFIFFGNQTESRGQTADALVMYLESVESAFDGSDLRITENNFVPTARCTQDTNW